MQKNSAPAVGRCVRTPHRPSQTPLRRAAAPVLESLEGRRLLAATLLKDIEPSTASSNPQSLLSAGGVAYFVVPDTTTTPTTYSLYRTDATDAGTLPVVAMPAAPRNMTASGGLAYFEAPQNGIPQVWRTDGTAAGTFPVTGFTRVQTSTRSFTDVNGTLFFVVTDTATNAVELWKSGGTAATTGRASPAATLASISNLVGVGNTLFFTASPRTVTADTELWKSDGTEAGTVRVKDIRAGTAGSSPQFLTNVAGTLFLIANDGTTPRGIWKSDGTDAGTVLVSGLAAQELSVVQNLTAVGGTLYVGGQTTTSTPKLLKSDGTSAGTAVVTEVTRGLGGISSPTIAFGGRLYFTLVTGGEGKELWSTDGTATGTSLVKDINPGGGSSNPAGFSVFGGALYFTANDGQHGTELWKTDGTAAGTTLVADVYAGSVSSNPGQAVVVGGAGSAPARLVFPATSPSYGAELWGTDGTPGGTAVVKDIASTPLSSNPAMFTTVGNRVFFTASGGLWVSDGSAGHTQFLAAAPIDLAGVEGSSGPTLVEWQRGLPTDVVLGDLLYFRSNGRLWRSDGTPVGTYQVSDAPQNVGSLAVSGNLIYFSADDGVSGNELWRSDGTAAGTYRVSDLYPGASGPAPRAIAPLPGGGVVFAQNNRLYRSDGTASGTVPLTGDTPLTDAYHATELGGLTYIPASQSMWATDGTVAGTRVVVPYGNLGIAQLSELRMLGGSVYFLAYDLNRVPGLWKTDGTWAGTVLVKAIGTSADSQSQPGYRLTVANGRLFFAGPGGGPLWVSDGTAAGTVQVGGSSSILPYVDIVAAGDRVYFDTGLALWVSDGTAAGTTKVADAPPPTRSLWQPMASAGGSLLFAATHPLYGSEPWVVDAPAALPAAPTGLTAVAQSAGEIDLTWTDASGNESGFRVERSTTPDFASVDQSVLLPPNRTHYADRPLAGGTNYYYRVFAVSRSGDSAPSPTASADTPSGPTAPADLSGSPRSATSVWMSWMDRSSDETGFVVQRSTDPGFDSVQATFTLPANTATYVDTTVSPLNRYYYRVFATGPSGNSDYAASPVISTPDYAPANFRAVPVSSSRIDLKWTNVSSTTTSFRVERGVDGGPINQLLTILSPSTTEYADIKASSGHTWQYRITAVTATGWSASTVVSAVTAPPVLTTPVKSLPPVVDGTPSSKPTRVVTAGGAGYFVANDGQLWRTDGTPAGTSLVASMTTITNLVDVNGTLYFVGSKSGAYYQALFKSDGTAAGTVLVKDIITQNVDLLHDLVAYNSKLYFRATPADSTSDSLWASDGTIEGTVEVVRFSPRNGNDIYRPMVVAGGKLWLGANTPGSGIPGVYVSDGTAAGTTLVTAADGTAPTNASNFVAVGSNLTYFVGTRGTDSARYWWRSDGTPEGTFRIDNAPVDRAALAQPLGNTLYFPGYLPDTDWQLLKVGPSDTTASAALPGGGGSPHAITPFGPGLAFFTTDGSSVTLQVTGADVSTATPLKQIPVLAGSTVPQAASFGGALYFFVREPSGVRALYRSDGTATGTVVVKRFAGFHEPGPFTVVGGRLTFAADDGVAGFEPWTTDGTSAGTLLLKDIANTVLPTKPDSMVTFGGAIYFTFTPMAGGRGPIYRTDGTPGGTSLIFDGQASGLFLAGDRMFFTALTPETGVELWVTDGTTAGTHMVVDLAPGTTGANPVPLAWLGDKLIFGLRSTNDTRDVYELWRTDGTAAGTLKLHDKVLMLSVPSGLPQAPVVMDGVMYFNGLDDDGVSLAAKLWRSDGTPEGTYQVKGFTSDTASFQPTQFTVLNGALYFYAPSDAHGWSLWRTDGTAAGTTHLLSADILSSLTAASGALYFAGPGGLWKSDGTPAGTALLSAGPTNATRFTAVGNTVYFFSNNSLWKTDGTPAGTVAIRALSDGPSGPNTSPQAYLVNVAGTLFYSNGVSLWRSDGTFEGTYQVAILSDTSTAQTQLVSTGALAAPLGDLLLFGMMTPDGGREIRTAYVTPPAAPTSLTNSGPAPSPSLDSTTGSPAIAAAAAPPPGVRLTWADNSTTESGFVIERSDTPDFATINATFFVPANATSYTDTSASPGDAYYYRVRAVNAGGASAPSNGITTPPATLLSADFLFDGPAHRLVLRFSADVAASLTVADLRLRNLTTGQDVPAGQMTLAYDPATRTATVTFAGGRLADGRYRLTLASGDILGANGLALDGNADGAPGGDYALDFFTLAGDANHDAAVNFDDLLILAKNYNQTAATLAQGDFTGDGVVNFDDLLLLAKNYNTALPPVGAAPAPAAPMNVAALSAAIGLAPAASPSATTPPPAPATATPHPAPRPMSPPRVAAKPPAEPPRRDSAKTNPVFSTTRVSRPAPKPTPAKPTVAAKAKGR